MKYTLVVDSHSENFEVYRFNNHITQLDIDPTKRSIINLIFDYLDRGNYPEEIKYFFEDNGPFYIYFYSNSIKVSCWLGYYMILIWD